MKETNGNGLDFSGSLQLRKERPNMSQQLGNEADWVNWYCNVWLDEYPA